MLFFFAFVGGLMWMLERIGDVFRALLPYLPILALVIGLVLALATAITLITITVIYRAVRQSLRWRALRYSTTGQPGT